MLFVVFGADCDHVGDIYECPQGTYAIQVSSSTTKQFHIIIHKNRNNKDIGNTNNKLFMILYNCNFMMYCMLFRTKFLFGGGGPVYFLVPHFLLHHWKTLLLLPHLRPLHTVTAYTSGPSTCGKKKLTFFENLKLLKNHNPLSNLKTQ